VKNLFVVAWACQHPHPPNLNTLQVKLGHAYLKTFFTNSTGNLLLVFRLLAQAVNLQIIQVYESVGKDTKKTLVNVPKSFVPLLGEISSFAIKQCLQQYERIAKLDPTKSCSNTLTKGVGIPCAHKIFEILKDEDSLLLNNFYPQWRLRHNPEATVSPIFLNQITSW
jgi:hypothetical protein